MKRSALYFIIITLFVVFLTGISLVVVLLYPNSMLTTQTDKTTIEETATIHTENKKEDLVQEVTTEDVVNVDSQTECVITESTYLENDKPTETTSFTIPTESESVSSETTKPTSTTTVRPIRPTEDDLGMGEF